MESYDLEIKLPIDIKYINECNRSLIKKIYKQSIKLTSLHHTKIASSFESNGSYDTYNAIGYDEELTISEVIALCDKFDSTDRINPAIDFTNGYLSFIVKHVNNKSKMYNPMNKDEFHKRQKILKNKLVSLNKCKLNNDNIHLMKPIHFILRHLQIENAKKCLHMNVEFNKTRNSLTVKVTGITGMIHLRMIEFIVSDYAKFIKFIKFNPVQKYIAFIFKRNDDKINVSSKIMKKRKRVYNGKKTSINGKIFKVNLKKRRSIPGFSDLLNKKNIASGNVEYNFN